MHTTLRTEDNLVQKKKGALEGSQEIKGRIPVNNKGIDLFFIYMWGLFCLTMCNVQDNLWRIISTFIKTTMSFIV